MEVYDDSKNKTAETKLKLNSLLEPCVSLTAGNSWQIAVPDPEHHVSIYMPGGDQTLKFDNPVTTPPASCHFFGDASWYTVIGAGKKVLVFAAY